MDSVRKRLRRGRDQRGAPARSVVPLLILVLFAFVSVAKPAAWEWPSAVFELDAGFGQLRNGRVSSGVWLAAETPEVRAAHPGEIIYQRRERAEGARMPHAFGNFTVVTHEDELRSLYSNMGSLNAVVEPTVEEGDPIGTVGISGFAYGDQLGIHLIDADLQQLVNPFLILPPRPDERSPVIAAVSVRINGESRPLPQGSSLPPGQGFAVYVDAYDAVPTNTGPRRIAPKELRVTLGDGEPEVVTFDTMRFSDGGLRLPSGRRLAEMYAEDGSLRIGTFSMGSEVTRLSIRVEDFAGNRASAEYRLVPVAPSEG